MSNIQEFKKELNQLIDKYFKEDDIIELVPKKPLTDIQKIVGVYKIVTGIEKNDVGWDKVHFARCAKSAKLLLDYLGSWKNAGDCIQDIYEKLTAKGLTVTIETVVKHSADWKKDYLEREAKHGGIHSQSDGSGQINR